MIFWLGFASMLFCILVTVRGAMRRSEAAGQSLRHSLAEAWTNIFIGFSINYAVNLVLLPMVGAEFGQEFTLWSNFWLGWVYTAVSFLRQLAIRRYYNFLHVRQHE